MQKLLQLKLRRRRAQAELSAAIVVIVTLVVAVMVAVFILGVGRSITGRPLLRAGYQSSVTADGKTLYLCLYNDGTVPLKGANVTVTAGQNTYTFSSVDVPAGKSWCGQGQRGSGSDTFYNVGQVDATIQITAAGYTDVLYTRLLVIGG